MKQWNLLIMNLESLNNNNNFNNMTKPIFLVGVPRNTDYEQVLKSQVELERKLDGYYSLVYQTNQDEIKFQCFYEKDFDEVKFEELKQIVKEYLITK